MTRQRSDIIAAQRRVWGDSPQLCAECDRDAEPYSCYCAECEKRLYEEENA